MKIVASWLSRKVGTLKTPLRADRVTGTEKFWQCFAKAEVARRVQANNDGRPIMSNEPLGRLREEGREGIVVHKVVGKEEQEFCEVIQV